MLNLKRFASGFVEIIITMGVKLDYKLTSLIDFILRGKMTESLKIVNILHLRVNMNLNSVTVAQNIRRELKQ